MPIEIVVPRLGWSMEEGIFGEWLKTPGDAVRAGEMIYVLEGEKAAQEIESFEAGTLWLAPDAPRKGDTVKVGQRIGFLLAAGEIPPSVVATPTVSHQQNSTPPSSPQKAATSVDGRGPAARRRARESKIDVASVDTLAPARRTLSDDIRQSSRAIASPRARRRANELGVRWEEATGTGRNGRIRERDVDAIAMRSERKPQNEIAPTALGTHQPASKIRLSIAQRMVAGANQTAPVTLTTKVDASALVAFRAKLKKTSKNEIVPSYSDIFVKLVAIALPECPLLNACWHRDGIYTYSAINIAIAVDTLSGLLAPVISDTAALTLESIASQSRQLIEKARAGALSHAELQKGTFTITNLGAFGIDSFTPIINLPQSAILGIGRIVREPVVRENAIMPGEMLTLSLTFDHRVIDGAPAAAWLQRLGQLAQKPESVCGMPS